MQLVLLKTAQNHLNFRGTKMVLKCKWNGTEMKVNCHWNEQQPLDKQKKIIWQRK